MKIENDEMNKDIAPEIIHEEQKEQGDITSLEPLINEETEPVPSPVPAEENEENITPEEVVCHEPDKTADVEVETPPINTCSINPDDLYRKLQHITDNVESIEKSSAKTAKEVFDLYKLYHTEYAKRLTSMERELAHYHKVDQGRIFDSILGEIASLYDKYLFMIDSAEDEKQKKNLTYLFEDMIEILEAKGVKTLKSQPGEKRNTRHAQVVATIPSNDHAQHDTVASSKNTGFYIDNLTLVKERVEVIIYKENTDQPKEVGE